LLFIHKILLLLLLLKIVFNKSFKVILNFVYLLTNLMQLIIFFILRALNFFNLKVKCFCILLNLFYSLYYFFLKYLLPLFQFRQRACVTILIILLVVLLKILSFMVVVYRHLSKIILLIFNIVNIIVIMFLF